jgi:hypothetical protein
LDCPQRGEKWNISTDTITTTEAAYSKKAAKEHEKNPKYY